MISAALADAWCQLACRLVRWSQQLQHALRYVLEAHYGLGCLFIGINFYWRPPECPDKMPQVPASRPSMAVYGSMWQTMQAAATFAANLFAGATYAVTCITY